MTASYFNRFFRAESILGRGSYGAVYLVQHKIGSVDLGQYALKKVLAIPLPSAHSFRSQLVKMWRGSKWYCAK